MIELYRHYNATTGDYLITTSSAPPGGYAMQAILGYGHSSGVASTQQNLAYTYDFVGNLKTITDAVWSASRSFEYDDLNRLKKATGTFGVNQALVTQDYTYDAIGNILSKAGVTYCYGYMAGCTDSNRLSGVKTTSDGASYTYDANGNIASGAGRTYIWNSDNRLDQVTGPGGSAVMTYDYTGMRIQKTGSSGTSYFPFTGYDVQGGTVTKYVRIGNEIIASKQGATKRFYHNDHLGGVNIISDWNGNQVQLTEYDPWGKVSSSLGLVDLTHRFTGQELDSESDVYYYGGRYYSQGVGRFISPDPFVQDPDDPQNLNRYAYVINSPQNYTDPTGYDFDLSFLGGWSGGGDQGSSWSSFGSDFGSRMWQVGLGAYDSGRGAAPTCNYGTGDCVLSSGTAWADENGGHIEMRKEVVPFSQLVAQAGGAGAAMDMDGFPSKGFSGVAGGTPDEQVAIWAARQQRALSWGVRPAPSTPASDSSSTPKVPNPYGRRGGLAHQSTVERRAAELEAQGYEIIKGGNRAKLTEEVIQTPGGYKSTRSPDITARAPDGSIYRENIGRSTKNGLPVARERRALDDIERATGRRPGFTVYDR